MSIVNFIIRPCHLVLVFNLENEVYFSFKFCFHKRLINQELVSCSNSRAKLLIIQRKTTQNFCLFGSDTTLPFLLFLLNYELGK